MSAPAERLGTLSGDFRAQLVVGAAEAAIPSNLTPEAQRAALNIVIASLEYRRESIVVDKILRETFADIPVIKDATNGD